MESERRVSVHVSRGLTQYYTLSLLLFIFLLFLLFFYFLFGRLTQEKRCRSGAGRAGLRFLGGRHDGVTVSQGQLKSIHE